MSVQPESIDLVYTWVNQSDPAWKKEFEKWSDLLKPGQKSVNDDRFRDCQEIRYSLISAIKFAKFIRNIYLVISSETQIADWMKEEYDIRFMGKYVSNSNKTNKTSIIVVVHRDIIPMKYLPTFNSVAIELFIHRIHGLSDNYLYFNDDMFFGREAQISDFIDSDGKALIFLDKSKPIRTNLERDQEYSFIRACAYTNKILDSLLGRNHGNRYHLQHLPYVHNKMADQKLLQLLVDNDLLTNTCTRFRENTNIKGQSLFYPYFSQHLGVSKIVYEPIGIKVSKDHYKHYNEILTARPLLFCLNKLEKCDTDLNDFYQSYFI